MEHFIKKYKIIVAYIHDLIAVFLAFIFSYLLRFNFDIPYEYSKQIWYVLPYLIIPQSIIFIYIGLYRGLWRFASLPDLKRIVLGAFIAFIFLILINYFLSNIPRSILFLFPILLIFFLGTNRFLYRFYKEGNFLKRKSGEPVLIIGAGSSGKALSKELSLNKNYNIIGFIDDDFTLHGR